MLSCSTGSVISDSQDGDPYEPAESITPYNISRCAARAGNLKLSGLAIKTTQNLLKQFLEARVRDAVNFTQHYHRKTVSIEDVATALKQDHCKYTSFSIMGLQAWPFGGRQARTEGPYVAQWEAAITRVNNGLVRWLRDLARDCAGADDQRKQELAYPCLEMEMCTDGHELPWTQAIAVAPSLLGLRGADVDDATLLHEAAELALEASRYHDEVPLPPLRTRKHLHAHMRAHAKTNRQSFCG